MDGPDDAIVRPQGECRAIRALHRQRHISASGHKRIGFRAEDRIQIIGFGTVRNDNHPIAVNLAKPDPTTVNDPFPIVIQLVRVRVDGEIPI